MNVGTVREAIATALQPIAEVEVNSYVLAQPNPPGLQVLPPGVDYDRAMARGLDEWTFVIQGFVALTQDVASQMLLDELCAPSGANSVKVRLEADPTLGGLVQSVRVMNQTPGIMVDRGSGGPMLLVEWRVQVFARGT